MLFASIALSDAARSFDKLYDYRLSIEDSLISAPGMRVLVPFGRSNQLKSAWIIKLWEGEAGEKIKAVSQIIDRYPLLSSEMIKLAEWMKNRYFCTWGDAVRIMIPSGVNLKKQIIYHASSDIDPQALSSELYKKILESGEGLSEQELACDEQSKNELDQLLKKGYVRISEIFDQRVNEKLVKGVQPFISKEEFDCLVEEGSVKSIHPVRVMEVLFAEEICSLQDILLIAGVTHNTIRNMVKKGWISYCTMEVERNPFDHMDIEIIQPPTLTVEQQQVLNSTLPYLAENKLNEVLLHGITGSGKTEIYLRLIENAISSGKRAIVLVPEISLTPQMVSRFTGRFGKKVAIQHSRLSQGERYDQWRRIRSGDVDVVIGARSAVFAPIENIGIIIVDEEHELSYKSENTPKYDARQVARARCNINGALLVLGSATPSIETYYRAVNGKIAFQVMKSRPNANPLPAVELVDLRQELKDGNRSALSRRLLRELEINKENNEQSILFLNRRGYASFMLCRDCGFTLKCPHCSVSLTVHIHDRQAICHYCGYSERIPKICPECKGANIKVFGTGTQKIEEELSDPTQGFRTIRMDLDTTSGKQGHQKLLDAFRNKEADILIGTQMVAKGHDFPDVTLVGIISADASLFTSDYRASERTFQLITQASGRAGRGEKPGRVILQAYNVDDCAIRTAMSQDYEAFYNEEIALRKQLFSPPFCHIGIIVVSSENQNDGRECAVRIRDHMVSGFQNEAGFECSEPLPSPVFIIRNRARWRLVIKAVSINSLVKMMNDLLDVFPRLKLRGTDVSVDIDPASMV